MAQPGRRSEVDVERLQITLAKSDAVVLDQIVQVGKFGRNRNDVAARVITDWLHDAAPVELDKFLARLSGGEEFNRKVPGRDEAAK